MERDLKKLRDNLVAQKTRYQTTILESKRALASIQDQLSCITPEDKATMAAYGYDLDWLDTIDYERLQNDQAYLDEINQKFEEVSEKLYGELVKALQE